MNVDIKNIIDLRHKLHRYAELSGSEYKTSEYLKKIILRYKPSKIVNLGETGFAVVINGQIKGKTVMFRSELDALPIQEPEDIHNRSYTDGVSHKCGHDGHMAILTGLTEAISKNRPLKGRVVMLFQPAEETLTGAKEIMQHPDFKEIAPDYIYAIHNLPGYTEGTMVYKFNNFTVATLGLTIDLYGNTSHAATPHLATNPTKTIIEILKFIQNKVDNNNFIDFVLATPVYTQIGSPDFGITPGTGQVKITLRANRADDLQKLLDIIEQKVSELSIKENLSYKFSYSDKALPVNNDNELIYNMLMAAKESKILTVKKDEPFSWSEDFGFFTQKYKGAMVGIGIGNSPPLHDKYYIFQDNIIQPTIKLLYTLYNKFYNKNI